MDMNATEAPPTSARATSSSARSGATVARVNAAPKPIAASTSARTPVRPRLATANPPATAPSPMAAVMKPKPEESLCSARLATTGRVTWNS